MDSDGPALAGVPGKVACMSAVASRPAYRRRGDPDDSTSEGKPSAETDLHRTLLIDLIGTLRDRLAADPTASASDDMRLYHEPGIKPAVAAFDLFVTLDVPREPPRRNSIVWREQAARHPHRVDFEDDEDSRRATVATLHQDGLRIPGYVLFDPTTGKPTVSTGASAG